MLTYLLILTIPTSAVSLYYARWEYRSKGNLSIFGLALLCLMLFIPNLVIHYSSSYEIPKTLLDFIGLIVGMAGITICIISIRKFRSILKVLCISAGKLTLSGPYKWCRNPQYLGWILFLFGFVLINRSFWGFTALLVVTLSLHLLVLIEEEHLLKTFGDQYTTFCRKVPRYFYRF